MAPVPVVVGITTRELDDQVKKLAFGAHDFIIFTLVGWLLDQ